MRNHLNHNQSARQPDVTATDRATCLKVSFTPGGTPVVSREKAKEMVSSASRVVRFRRAHFTYPDACRIARRAVNCLGPRMLQLDLQGAITITTAALARLIILRRSLMAREADLRLSGLRDQTLAVYLLSRLERVLPQV